MRITLDIHASSATLALAVRELRRQYDAMGERYPEMQRRGMISGKEAERRLFAQGVAVQALQEMAAAVAGEERATQAFGPRNDE